MANEWVKVELYGQNNDGDQRSYTCGANDVIPKGTLLSLFAGRIASTALVGATAYAGVAAMDKEADGSTRITAWTNGIFLATSSGAINVGVAIVGAEANKIASGSIVVTNPTLIGAGTLGYVLDTFANGETKNIRLLL